MMAQERVVFTISKEGNVRFEYKGLAGSGCVEELNKVLQYVGSHSVIDEGHTSDYYKPSVEKKVSRWLNQ